MIAQLRHTSGNISEIIITDYILWEFVGVDFRDRACPYVHDLLFIDGWHEHGQNKYYTENWLIINGKEHRVNKDDTPASYLKRILTVAHNIEIEEATNVLE